MAVNANLAGQAFDGTLRGDLHLTKRGGGVVFDNPIEFTCGALGGDGTLLTPVTVPKGGTLTPGGSAGTLLLLRRRRTR
ncbi:MAG: hypothetical protein N2689_04170 [Verrucomicrobiae bacterium]|nr:hypothetical protein [Verrucomicrobiae bacterium]